MNACSKRFKIAIACFALSSCTAVPAEAAQPPSVDVRSFAFVKVSAPSDLEFVDVDWETVPSAADVARYWTPEMYNLGMVQLSCGLSDHRTLMNCKVLKAAPAGTAMEPLYRGLAASFRVTPAFFDAHHSRLHSIHVNMRVKNPAGREPSTLPCLAPFCVPVPPPPPPPPPSRQ